MTCLTVLLLIIIYFLSFKIESPVRNIKRVEFGEVVKAVPKYFAQPLTRKFIIFIILSRFVFYLTPEIMFLEFIKNGIERSTLVNINSIFIPVTLIIKILSSKVIVGGKLLTYYHWIMFLSFIILWIQFFNLITFLKDFNEIRALTIQIFTTFFFSIQILDGDLLFGFSNLVVDEKYGSTGMTLMMSILNCSTLLPKTIGFKMVQYIDFRYFAVGSFLVYLVCWAGTYSTARFLDMCDPEK